MTNHSPTRPGWPEIIAGLTGLVVVGFGGSILVTRLPIDPAAVGLIMTAMSGIGGMAGFLAAYWLRRLDLAAFGIRATTRRWILIGVGGGILGFLAKSAAILAYIAITGDESSPQDIYADGGSGGALNLVLATFFLAIVTPLGEEFLFRGVVTTALLRYGAVVGVVGGALIFAVFHGINPIFPAAFVSGLIAGEIFRRSGSIWPAVLVHAVINLPTVPVLVMARMAD